MAELVARKLVAKPCGRASGKKVSGKNLVARKLVARPCGEKASGETLWRKGLWQKALAASILTTNPLEVTFLTATLLHPTSNLSGPHITNFNFCIFGNNNYKCVVGTNAHDDKGKAWLDINIS